MAQRVDAGDGSDENDYESDDFESDDDLQPYSSDTSSSSGDLSSTSSDSGDENDVNAAGPWNRPWVTIVDANADTVPRHAFGFDFDGGTGPQNALPGDAEPVRYYLQLLDGILDKFVVETNSYGDEKVNRNRPLRRRSRLNLWTHVDVTEFKAFLGLVVNMGLNRKTRINEYWNSRNRSQAFPIYPATMSRDRFLIILAMFNFPARAHVNGRDESLSLARVNNLVDELVVKFEHHYRPAREISVDESLVGFSGKWSAGHDIGHWPAGPTAIFSRRASRATSMHLFTGPMGH